MGEAVSQVVPFYSIISFWFSIMMSALAFLLFAYISISESVARSVRADRAVRDLESLPNVGNIAEKFAKSGAAPSALACCVLFMLIGTAIALALDKLRIFPNLFGGS